MKPPVLTFSFAYPGAADTPGMWSVDFVSEGTPYHGSVSTQALLAAVPPELSSVLSDSLSSVVTELESTATRLDDEKQAYVDSANLLSGDIAAVAATENS